MYSARILPLVAQDLSTSSQQVCDPSRRDYVCDFVYNWTENESAAKAAGWFLQRPIQILFVLVCAWLFARVAKRAISQLTKKIGDVSASRGQSGRQSNDVKARAKSRAETLGHVLRSLALTGIWTLALLIVISELGINLGPLIAGAGIAGIALGFGAQSIVRDFLAGMFILIEDHYGVGDMIDFGGVMGNVEEVTLRATKVRDRNGAVWHVPNGKIERVGNFSQVGLRARINIGVAYSADLRLAINVINRVGEEMWSTQWCRQRLAGPPKVSGVQDLGESSVDVRVVVETLPALPWSEKRSMEREFRLRVKEAFDLEGVEIPFPQRAVWLHHSGAESEHSSAIG